MPICIAGMHRSGTSMIARMLNLCGLYLGEESELHAAKPDNPEGFWEHIGFQDINDKLLALFGGAWDVVPVLPEDWLQRPEVLAAKEEAKELVADFNRRGKGTWGWKDPRNSITLPFWKEVIPDLRVVVAVRNPVDVAASLTKRAYASEKFGVSLWQAYMDAIVPSLSPETTIYTHYATYFQYPEEELARVNAFCGLTPSPSELRAACETVSGSLRHSDATFGDLLAAEGGPDTIRTYFEACMAAGPAYEKVWRAEAAMLAGIMRDREVISLKAVIEANKKEIAEAKSTIESVYAKYNAQIAETQAVHQQKLEQARESERKRVSHLQAEMAKLNAHRAAVESEAQRLAQEVHNLQAEAEILRPKALLADQFEPYRRALGANGVLRLLAGATARMQQGGVKLVARGVAKKVVRTFVPAKPALPRPQPTPAPVETPTETNKKGPASLLEVLGIGSEAVSAADLEAMLKEALEFKTYALSLSHDSFQAYTGGIQTVIREEMEAFRAKGVSHLHLCPMEGEAKSESGQSLLIVSTGGKPLCLAGVQDVQAVLGTLASDARVCQSVQIHHLLNWDLDELGGLLATAPDVSRFLWVHDYYTICEGYNLLRNDRAFCNAPPVDSNSCTICKYGKNRPQHLARVSGFLRQWGFTFLTPSEKSAEIWRKAYPDLADRLSVTPLYALESSDRENARPDPVGRPLKLAYVGISYVHKGWGNWRKLVDALEANEDYELIHFGQRTPEFMHTRFPERFERVRSGPDNPKAMPDALEREMIDLVFYCPIWPETFSLIAYESQATGCWTLTIKDSGNVACFVAQTGSGRVFDDINVLVAYLQDSEQVRRDLGQRRQNVEFLSDMRYQTSIVDSLYLGQ